ncbi:MAG TPA: hypothetical protein VD903_01095 [Pseudonocardia sp.]|nr:hypothetical protein [Pseudonocardia sp.]
MPSSSHSRIRSNDCGAGSSRPGSSAQLLRPDDVVAWRGTDVGRLPQVLREVLTGAAATRA